MHNRIKLHAFFFGKNNERKGKSMIVQLIENIYQFLWGEWIHVPLPGGGSLGLSLLIILLLPAGIVFTIKTKFLQIRKFPYAMKETLGRVFKKQDASDGSMTPFQAVCTALASTVGTGNIAGVAGAIAIGGPGAVLCTISRMVLAKTGIFLLYYSLLSEF